MKGISAVIITFNEERNIARCIDSLADIASEVLVVDSFSNDRTIEIARKKGARVIQREWEGYAATKNYANSLVQNEYILSVDADEALSCHLKDSILKEKQRGLKGVYEFSRLTNYCGKWIRYGGWYPDRKIRLFPKDGSLWNGEFVHEKLSFSGDPVKTTLKGDLLHYSYYTIQDHRLRIEKYSVLEAKKLQANRKRFFWVGLVLGPPLQFIKMYFLKAGFLDGYYGFAVAAMSAFAKFKRYNEAIKLNNKTGKTISE